MIKLKNKQKGTKNTSVKKILKKENKLLNSQAHLIEALDKIKLKDDPPQKRPRRKAYLFRSPAIKTSLITHTPYVRSLMYPETAAQSRLPGMCSKTVALKRHISTIITTNALGAGGGAFFPWLTSTTVSSFYYTANATYDGITTSGANQPQTVFINQNITAGTVIEYRPVSCAITITPQASVLNQSGTIHMAVQNLVGIAPQNAGVNFPVIDATLVPNYQNIATKAQASVSAMQGIRAIWVPNDNCLLEPSAINANVYGTNGGAFPHILFTIIGAPTANFRVDMYFNFEVIPAPTSTLIGMEALDPYNETASTVWREIAIQTPAMVSTFTGDPIGSILAQNDYQNQALERSYVNPRQENVFANTYRTGVGKNAMFG